MSYLCYLCLFTYSGVQCMLCFALFVFVLCISCNQFLCLVHFLLRLLYYVTFIVNAYCNQRLFNILYI